ncbi:MAG: ATP synthase F1 subunit delta [Chitinophagia bacterium]|nr:ATP synthase F1 subunit delta [Chitinophagia bacterium]
MQNPRLALRYAKSLLDLAIEKNAVEATLQDVRLLDAICKQNRDFFVILRSPVIDGAKKVAVINAIVKDSLQPLTKAFIDIVARKGRETYLAEILESFIAQYEKLNNIKVVNLTTAVAMDDQMKTAIMAQVQQIAQGATISLRTKVDASLIGGYIVETDDRLLDMSVRKKLNELRTKVVDLSYVSKM